MRAFAIVMLAGALVWFVWALPQFVEHGREGIRLQQLVFDVAWQRRDWPAMALAVVSITLLLVPLVGVAVMVWRLATTLTTLVRRRLARQVTARTQEQAVERFAQPPAPEPAVLSAVVKAWLAPVPAWKGAAKRAPCR